MEWNIEIRYQGEPRRARVRDVTTTSIEMVFKVIFEDGYQNTFFIPLGENRWTEWKRGDTVLAQVVGAAIEQAINNDRDRKDPPPALRRKAYETELDDDGALVQLTFVETSALGAPRQYLVIFGDGYENIFYTADDDTWLEADLGATRLALLVGRAIRLTLRMQS